MRKFVFVTLPMWINVPAISLWSNFFNFLNEEFFFNNYVLMEICHQRGKWLGPYWVWWEVFSWIFFLNQMSWHDWHPLRFQFLSMWQHWQISFLSMHFSTFLDDFNSKLFFTPYYYHTKIWSKIWYALPVYHFHFSISSL